MTIKKTYLLFFLSFFLAGIEVGAQTRDSIYNYFAHYRHPGQKLKPSALSSYIVDPTSKTVSISVGGGFNEQAFTSDIVEGIYDRIRSFLPDSISRFKVGISTSGRLIEDMVPNSYRKKDFDKSRMWDKEYSGAPWVRNMKSEASSDKGFQGSHLAVWQSHGRFYKAARHTWDWQRPRLYCTTEDLFTQTFVIPYIIPMLENAGAVVYTPRDRNWQNNEIIIDNDFPTQDGLYRETNLGKTGWQQSDSAGFAQIWDSYSISDNPFRNGTARHIETTSSSKEESTISWTPYIPEAGDYAVYVSYQTLPKSISDARYQVWHKGVMTEFRVNQQIGGSTWVYLGTFSFDEGMNKDGCVILTNHSDGKGVVSADAVRFGCGMGNVLGGGTVSGLPRWAEASRYYTQWAGLTQKVYDHYHGTDDYKDDLYVRPRAINELAGGSLFVNDSIGRNVPFELAVAFHSDAGFSRNGDLSGSLTVCTTKRIKFHKIVIEPEAAVLTDSILNDSLASVAVSDSVSSDSIVPVSAPSDSITYYTGIDRYASHDIASTLLSGLSSDLAKYGWPIRPIWDKDYCETREPTIPSAILEMLSHENFFDMCLGYDPQFKFDFSRSVYKSLLRYVAATHKREYVVQPLPVRNFSAMLTDDEEKTELSWTPVDDPLEPTASPQYYIVYTRTDDGDFDNGIKVKSTSCRLPIQKGHIYSYKVVAGNKGGVSFPSEILSVYSSPENRGTILLVNAFTRLEGPAQIRTADQLGFDLDLDPGVQYGLFAGFCGRQKVFSTKHMGSSGDNATGRSGNELEGRLVMGNTFDYPSVHGSAIKAFGRHSFCSVSSGAVADGTVRLSSFSLVDVICGVQKSYDSHLVSALENYASKDRPLLITGANIDTLWTFVPQSSPRADREGFVTDPDSVYSYRFFSEMNDQSYSVPTQSSFSADGATPLLSYPDHSCAAAIKRRTLVCGVPLESFRTRQERTNLMSQFLTSLLP